MALTSANLTKEPRSFSIGPVKIQIKTITAANADVSGTITFDSLSELMAVSVTGIVLDAAPTYATNVATLSFKDPADDVFGLAIGIGK